MNNFISLLILLSFIYTNQFSTIESGNIEKFALMNGRSYVDNIFSPNTHSINFSLIKYPSQVSLNHISYNKDFNDYIINSKLVLLNWGTLSEINDHGDIKKFKASEKNIEISILKKFSNQFFLGSSIKYLSSNIDSYNSQYLVQDIGVTKILFNNHLQVGLSMENMIRAINTYFNVDSEYKPRINIGLSYHPQNIDAGVYMNYLHENDINNELIFGVKNKIKDSFILYIGKSFYINKISSYSIYDNFSFGIGLQRQKYTTNLAIQYIGDLGFVVGSSISILFNNS